MNEEKMIKESYSEIIFSPDPRENYISSVLPEEDLEKAYYENNAVITIHLGKNGRFGNDGNSAAYLIRGKDGFYRLSVYNLNDDKFLFESIMVFKDTYNVQRVCYKVEELFQKGIIKPYFSKFRNMPVLIDARQDK